MAREIAASGRRTILERHTCAHRADELIEIDRELRGLPAATWRAQGAARTAEVGMP
jgi:spore maturation protein CgeB